MTDKKDVITDSGKDVDTSLLKTLDSFLPETLKRALFAGAGMLFMTEEGVRKALSEINLPRDAVNYIIKQSEKSKKEFFTIFQRELTRFLDKVDVTRLSKEVLDGIAIEVNAKVTLRATEEKAPVSVKVNKLKASPTRKKKAKSAKSAKSTKK